MKDSEIKKAKKLAMAAVAALAGSGASQANAEALASLRQESGTTAKLASKSALVQQILESQSIDEEGYDRNFDRYDRTVDKVAERIIPGITPGGLIPNDLIKEPGLLDKFGK
ncbi:hypothetical protein [Oligoflexus tunisiensis]|uniref:hypothetical protein n=1 Tax=Oligoflexus tunisiensis TaxID=708132 RepID=UPI00114C956B|nr:hypothetical protein [Oligoflexus tunisiensis]